MTPALVERDNRNRFCPIHPTEKVTRTKITDAEDNTRWILKCPICGISDKW